MKTLYRLLVLTFVLTLFACTEKGEFIDNYRYEVATYRSSFFLTSDYAGFSKQTVRSYDVKFSHIGDIVDINVNADGDMKHWALNDDGLNKEQFQIKQDSNHITIKLLTPVSYVYTLGGQLRIEGFNSVFWSDYWYIEVNFWEDNDSLRRLEELPYTESFSSSLYDFRNYTISGNGEWKVANNCVTSGSSVGDYYLVGPPISLKEVSEAYISYDYSDMANAGEKQEVLISTDYVGGDPAKATWRVLNNTHALCSTSSEFKTKQINIPSEYMGKYVFLAFRYQASSTVTNPTAWSIKNFSVLGGAIEEVETSKSLPYSESFESSLGEFKSVLTSGSGSWINDFHTAQASGYDNYTKETVAGTYYLVSPEISLANVTEANISYEYILRYNKGDENQKILISTDYADNAQTATWTLLNNKHTEGVDWTTFERKVINIPADYMGKTIRIAFYYNTNAVIGSTWQVRNFAIEEGTAVEDAPDTPSETDGLESFANGDFEQWNGDTPVNWTTASTAGNATLSKSTDAHGGSYSVKVGGITNANKRIAYKEMKLAAGTYTVKFWTKAATAEGGSVRPGYATFNADGTINASGYKYSNEYFDNITNSSWAKVEYVFTLDTDQQICLVVMNSKNPGKDVLIDDFTIEKGDTSDDSGDTNTYSTYTVNGVSFKMIKVDGGTFSMGATSEQGSDAYSDEKPVHQVTLGDYYIGETEVTQELWYAVMGYRPTSGGSQWSSSYGLGDDYPAYYVSWNDCQEFITKLNGLAGVTFSLPTEAQWEFAARGGNKSLGYKYSGSNTVGDVAWYCDNTGSTVHTVATKQANELGIYDMSGNVYEWCQDWYGSYSSSSQTNPTGPATGTYRVLRGGCWYYGDAIYCRVSNRLNSTPTDRNHSIGLRLALSSL